MPTIQVIVMKLYTNHSFENGSIMVCSIMGLMYLDLLNLINIYKTINKRGDESPLFNIINYALFF